MSRAFVTEGDGWTFCQSHRQSCLYADEYGRCIFRECRLDEEAREQAGSIEPPKDEGGMPSGSD